MAVLLTVLKVLGIVFLVLLAILLVLMLLVLFVPFRYSFSGEIDDPEGSSRLFHLDPQKDLSMSGDIRWLLGAFHLSAEIGGGDGKGSPVRLNLRIFGFRYPLDRFLNRPKKDGTEEKKKPKAPEEKKSLEEKIEAVLARVEKLYRRMEDVLYVLQTEYGTRAKEVVLSRILRMIEAVLPYEWGITGVIGLGDPARSARVFAVQGFLYPVTSGHVAIGTEYELYRFDLRGAARGALQLFPFLYGVIRILLCRDVRRVLGRIRRGPAAGHRYGNGRTKARNRQQETV